MIFCTVVHGIASMREPAGSAGSGGKALIYFEVVSTFALAIGLVVAKVFQTGERLQHRPRPARSPRRSSRLHPEGAGATASSPICMAIIPDTFVGAFAQGELLQVLLLAVLTGFAINALPEPARLAVCHAVDRLSEIFFGMVKIVVKAAPIGAFGAMAFTIGAYGIGSLLKLGELVATFYLTSLALRAGRAGDHRPLLRLLDLPLPRLHPRGAADRARHLQLAKACCRR